MISSSPPDCLRANKWSNAASKWNSISHHRLILFLIRIKKRPFLVWFHFTASPGNFLILEASCDEIILMIRFAFVTTIIDGNYQTMRINGANLEWRARLRWDRRMQMHAATSPHFLRPLISRFRWFSVTCRSLQWLPPHKWLPVPLIIRCTGLDLHHIWIHLLTNELSLIFETTLENAWDTVVTLFFQREERGQSMKLRNDAPPDQLRRWRHKNTWEHA